MSSKNDEKESAPVDIPAENVERERESKIGRRQREIEDSLVEVFGKKVKERKKDKNIDNQRSKNVGMQSKKQQTRKTSKIYYGRKRA